MKIIDGLWSVVIVGKWNRYILTPEWVGKKIFDDEELDVQLPINRPELSPRYQSKDKILFLPGTHRCQFLPQEPYDDSMLKAIGSYIKKLVSILEHTPVSAIGFNFVFEAKSDEFSNLSLFNLNDSEECIASGLREESTEIKRNFSFDDYFLNLTLRYQTEKILLDYNFHYDVTTPKEIGDLLKDESLIISFKNKALELSDKVYGLTLTKEEEE